MTLYRVRTADGTVVAETENPMTAVRFWAQLKDAVIVCSSRYAAVFLFSTIRQNEGYFYFQLVKHGMDVKDRKEAARIIRRAVRYSDLSVAVDEAALL